MSTARTTCPSFDAMASRAFAIRKTRHRKRSYRNYVPPSPWKLGHEPRKPAPQHFVRTSRLYRSRFVPNVLDDALPDGEIIVACHSGRNDGFVPLNYIHYLMYKDGSYYIAKFQQDKWPDGMIQSFGLYRIVEPAALEGIVSALRTDHEKPSLELSQVYYTWDPGQSPMVGENLPFLFQV